MVTLEPRVVPVWPCAGGYHPRPVPSIILPASVHGTVAAGRDTRREVAQPSLAVAGPTVLAPSGSQPELPAALGALILVGVEFVLPGVRIFYAAEQ